MYKVFFNQRLINISSPENITLNKTINPAAPPLTVPEIKKWFQEFAKGNVDEVNFVHVSPSSFFETFKSAFVNIDAAGGVVFNREGEMLVIFRNGVWDLPKGKVDKGETTRRAAIREVMEECGITGLQIVKKLPSTYHIYQSPYKKTKGQWIFKETFWYEMKYSGHSQGTPQYEEGITETEWVSLRGLGGVFANTYENLKLIFSLYS